MADRQALVFDPVGRFTHVAQGLARQDHVLYFNPLVGGAVSSASVLPGIGLKNVTRVNDFFNHIDACDYVVFPGVGNGDLQEYLRGNRVAVFGAGWATDLEEDRWLLRKELAKVGLNTPPGHILKGTDELHKYLKRVPEGWIKVNLLRGDMETFHHKGMLQTQAWFDTLVDKLGPYQSLAEFTVEESVADDNSVEVGADFFVCQGEMVPNPSWGYEIKDAFYAGITTPLPPRLASATKKHINMLDNYSGAVSNELKVTKSDEWFLDATHRFGLPPSQLQSQWIENFADVVHGIAIGKPIAPVYRGNVGVQVTLRSEWFQNHPLACGIEMPDQVSLYGQCEIDGQSYATNFLPNVENLVECGAAFGWGNSLTAAISNSLEAADSVTGLYLDYNKGNISKGLDTIRQGSKLGLRWGSMISNMEE